MAVVHMEGLLAATVPVVAVVTLAIDNFAFDTAYHQ